MASWTTPTTRTSLELIDDADWNTDVTENLKFLYQPPIFWGGTAAGQTIPNDAITGISLNTEGFKRGITHSTSTNPSRVTIDTTGIYLVVITGLWAVNATGRRAVYMYKNGVAVDFITDTPASTGEATGQYVNIWSLTATDYIEAAFYQNSGGDLLLTPDMKVTWQSGP